MRAAKWSSRWRHEGEDNARHENHPFGTWVVVTLIYLYGDVLRIYHGGEMAKALADMKLTSSFGWGSQF